MKNNIATIFICMAICMCATGVGAYEIDDDLVNAIAQVESSNNRLAYNERTRCAGLLQISEIVLQEWNEDTEIDVEPRHYEKIDLFNEQISRQIGTWYLKRLRDRYGCPTLRDCLAAYNFGIDACRRVNFEWERYPKSVRAYVDKVIRIYERI